MAQAKEGTIEYKKKSSNAFLLTDISPGKYDYVCEY